MLQLKNMFIGAFVILLAYYVGVFISISLSLPIPGPLLGLVFLLLLLFAFPNIEKHTTLVAQPFLKHMSVLFVPAVLGVGIYWSEIETNAVALVLAIGGTTVLSLGLAAWVANRLMKKKSM
ncbi:CidA/LrgA family protein [Alteromonas sp. A081]|uniref:CidA/LrgA family protein n=1 Tax=Alteromonas sp. A081 TaxID=3410269 RepID=UPI003B97FD76